MSLALTAEMTFTDNSADFAADVEWAADYGLASVAVNAIELIQIASPYKTGSLESSVHAASPGYSIDETAIYDRRIKGVYREATVPTIAQVMALIEDGHIWVGSWIDYAYYVDRGYYNVWAQAAFAGRNFIVPNCIATLREFPAHFRRGYAIRTATDTEVRS